ncbi:thermonuclease family protein [Paenibacillus sp. sptzw28]|nr:thermonuclease family protein [Paenibacillus sp. sptzw28]
MAYVYLPACPANADTKKLCEKEGNSVAKMELAKGLARVAYIYEPNTKYVDEYRKVEAEAMQKKIGVWSIDNYVRDDGYHPQVHTNTEAKPAEQSEPVPHKHRDDLFLI